MKNGLFKNKKFIIILGIVLVVALVVCLFIFLKNDVAFLIYFPLVPC